MTEARGGGESEEMRHAVEKHYRREREKAAQSFQPLTTVFIEQDIGKEAHIHRAMPLFLTLRDKDGKALVTAMLPPGGREEPVVRLHHRRARQRRPLSAARRRHQGAGRSFRYRARSGRTATPIGADDTTGGTAMGYTLEQFAADCHAALKSQPGTAGPREGARPGEARR